MPLAAPKGYIKKFEKDLLLRGIDKPIDNLPWITLFDGLYSQKLLQELDWKFYPEDFVETVLLLVLNKPRTTQIRDVLLSLNFSDNKEDEAEEIIAEN